MKPFFEKSPQRHSTLDFNESTDRGRYVEIHPPLGAGDTKLGNYCCSKAHEFSRKQLLEFGIVSCKSFHGRAFRVLCENRHNLRLNPRRATVSLILSILSRLRSRSGASLSGFQPETC